MFSKIFLTGLLVAGLSVPVLYAQGAGTGRADDSRGRVESPRPGGISTIGVRLSDITAESMKALKVSRAEGAVVESVNAGSPAAAAGLREKDVIVQFDGDRVRSASHLTRLVHETPAGREVALSVVRDGQKVELRIKPELSQSGWFDPGFGIGIDSDTWRESMEQAGRAARELGRELPEAMEGVRQGLAPRRGRLGLGVQELGAELAAYFGVKAGVLIASVVPDSPGAKAGLRAGDVITAVNGKAVGSPRDLVAVVSGVDGAGEVTLSVVREKKDLTLKAKLLPESSERPARGGQKV